MVNTSKEKVQITKNLKNVIIQQSKFAILK